MPHSDPHFSKYTQRQRIVAFAGAVLGAVLFSNKAILAKLMYREGADALEHSGTGAVDGSRAERVPHVEQPDEHQRQQCKRDQHQ